jgi:hypothetical protein
MNIQQFELAKSCPYETLDGSKMKPEFPPIISLEPGFRGYGFISCPITSLEPGFRGYGFISCPITSLRPEFPNIDSMSPKFNPFGSLSPYGILPPWISRIDSMDPKFNPFSSLGPGMGPGKP